MSAEGAKPVQLYVYNSTSKTWEKWDGVLSTGDIAIGAVEIKNSTDDTRATVGANGLEVDVKASALPTGAATSANQTDGSQQSKVKEVAPTDATKTNPSFALTYDGDDQCTNIALTTGGVTYNRTLTWAGGLVTAISTWS